ncbi:Ribosomal protein S12 methylthiotransferase RimO [Anaerobiospirillum thomasii]|uniref:30S ribosomal protein S12 methylthiotransferase RimO n=1 Tax=Anaerobiospirillum thomasii TaxID=179995 RepID=UPI000D9F420B|nr:30S ribosomal protein S12 methylthiotransferase RimO [Anaerobiospirillum thomasii]SPT71574.1 Ribosomal protein S12 methylthiotransferase RimO [Anaerobiospirillum thomasii]
MQKIPSIGIVSLGCAKNLVDTQRLTSLLVARGYQIKDEYDSCDLIIVNTCGFVAPAIKESLEAIGVALEHSQKVIVMGCLGSNDKLILQNYPNVLAVYGPGMRASVMRGVIKAIGEPPQDAVQRVNPSGILLTPPHYAYVKVAEGCRHRCSFCIIPKLRGPLRSRSVDHIYAECSDLVKNGVKELLVIAQDSSDYGIDLKEKSSIYDLCLKLSELKRWIRVHYVYPSAAADSLVELMADRKIVPYIDVPLQHAHPDVLKAMRRPGNIEKTLKTIERWREICPDIAIRSTFIAGFPGETDEQFNFLLDFLKEAKLDRVGCFAYSDVEGAAANSIEPSVPFDVRQDRVARLMELQEQISYAKLQQRIGKSYEIIVDSVTDEHVAIGRSMYESPDIDGQIFIEDARGIRAGDIVKAIITQADAHDMNAMLPSKYNQTTIPFARV